MYGNADPAAVTNQVRRGLMSKLDGVGRITAHGRAMAALPLHPRLAHMLLTAGRGAAPLAALLAERDPLRGAPAEVVDALAKRTVAMAVQGIVRAA